MGVRYRPPSTSLMSTSFPAAVVTICFTQRAGAELKMARVATKTATVETPSRRSYIVGYEPSVKPLMYFSTFV